MRKRIEKFMLILGIYILKVESSKLGLRKIKFSKSWYIILNSENLNKNNANSLVTTGSTDVGAKMRMRLLFV